ncbi:MAG: winged helix-turn-helix transcriptional regulator [Candidatus Methanodesulfokora sp.]|jgi:predicted transcriptional regulator
MDDFTMKVLEVIKRRGPSSCKEIAQDIGVSAQKVAAKMRYIVKLGLVEKKDGKYELSKAGESAIKQ